MQIFVNNLWNWWSIDPLPQWNFSDCSVAQRFVVLTQQQRLNCVDVIISMRTASAAAQTHVDCSELHQQPIDAVLRPTFVHKLSYKLPERCNLYILADFWLKLCLIYWAASKLPRLLHTVSKFTLFSVSDLKDEKLIKMQTYMKTESCKLYSRDFWIFLPNKIKINRYNFELYRFKVGPFFETQCSISASQHFQWLQTLSNRHLRLNSVLRQYVWSSELWSLGFRSLSTVNLLWMHGEL